MNKKERKEEIVNLINSSKSKDFHVKKISYNTPLEAIQNTAPSLLENGKKKRR